MVDNLNTTPDEPLEAEPAAKTGAAASQPSKVLLGIIAAVAVVAVLAVLGFLYLSSASEPELTSAPPQSETGGTTSSETSTEAVSPPEPDLSETFAFRNIFAPSVKAPAPPASTDDGDSDSDGDSASDPAANAAPDELVLVSIQTTDGEKTATFAWNGQTYVLAEGDSIPDSPWKVISIGSDSATVIYGDSSPIELSVGGSVSK